MNPILPANWKTLPGPHDIHKVELPNGITLLNRSNFYSPSVVISGYLPTGSLFDPDERLGQAQFTSSALMRGNQKRPFHEIYDCLESVGASLSFGASVHTTSFFGRALVEDLPLLLELINDSLRMPTFPIEYVERLRSQFLAGLAIREQDTAEMSDLRFDQLLFHDHPYARPEDGFPNTINNISRDDLIAYHRRHFGPRGMVLAVVGAVQPEQLRDQIEAVLGDWINPDQPDQPELPVVTTPTEEIREHIVIPGKSQTDLVMGRLGPKRLSEDYMPASLGNNILGQFGMMGRIGDSVREKSGLAYHASTSLNAWMTTGSWDVSAGVNPLNLERAIDLIKAEIRRFVSEPVTQAELEDSQSNFIGRLPLSLESNAGVAQALIKIHRFNLGLDYYQRFPGLVQSVTPEAVLEAARRYLNPDQMVIVSAGPELANNGAA